ncbi:hypothetical protein, partial [Cupriavidus metallidurans]|uniref:hypothetical protein n=1 Tax=Cupriavidus metallidurans TaxID=119219 RepID=UPI000564C254
MGKKKNYEVSAVRREQLHAGASEMAPTAFAENGGSARIDMVELLGEEARFTGGEKNIILDAWLGRGIDAWVRATLACLRVFLLSGSREPSTVVNYSRSMSVFFTFLIGEGKAPRISTPAALSPMHIEAFVSWLILRGQKTGHQSETERNVYKSVKAVIRAMFRQGYIAGEWTRFFRRRALPVSNGSSLNTSLSEAEQVRLANAIKTDLVAIHNGRLNLNPKDVQTLRLLLVAHRQGHNAAPLLELERSDMLAGLLPGTMRMRTRKSRNKRVLSKPGRAVSSRESGDGDEEEIVFGLAEGAVVQQAISSSEALLEKAPAHLRNRVWLYASQKHGEVGTVSALTRSAICQAISALAVRHDLRADNGGRLRINLSRTRKSFFDRALRVTDGDLERTANLMGNTRGVAGRNYPSMNEARQREAAEFMNEDYVNLMRAGGQVSEAPEGGPPRVIEIKPVDVAQKRTPIAGCRDTLNGQYAPHDGHNHCDRFVMCLFCASFAIVGTVDELWRLFSFQEFARAELEYLDATLGPERTDDEDLEDLRD